MQLIDTGTVYFHPNGYVPSRSGTFRYVPSAPHPLEWLPRQQSLRLRGVTSQIGVRSGIVSITLPSSYASARFCADRIGVVLFFGLGFMVVLSLAISSTR